MKENKYFDWNNNKVLSGEDGCEYSEWNQSLGNYPFAIHPYGFLVFLSPNEIKQSDEYSEEDPYTFDLTNKFHSSRVEATLELMEVAFNDHRFPIRVLDMGCGKGYITCEIQKRYPLSEISGLDYSLSAIQFAVQNNPKIDFIAANAYNPPYLKDYFDIIICNNLWEHVPDPLFLLKAIRRITKPGGFVIISTPSRYRIQNIFRFILGKPIRLISDYHVTEYSVGQIIEQLRYGKYEVVRIPRKSIPIEIKTFKDFLIYKIAKPILFVYLNLIHSHHCLESTAFYLAKSAGE